MNAPETLSRNHLVFLKTTNPLHISDAPGSPQDDNVAASFADVLKGAINKVNDL